MKKRLLNSLLLSVLMMVGATFVWAATKAKYEPTLKANTAIEGCAVKAYYDLSSVDANGICPTEGSLRYRPDWGLFAYADSTDAEGNTIALNKAIGTVALNVAEGDLVLVEFKDTQHRGITINEISSCTKNTELSSDEIVAFDVNADATSLEFNVGRRACIIAILVLEKKLSYTVNEVAGGKVVRATEGAAGPGQVSVPYRKYNVLDGKLYKKEKGFSNKNEFNYVFTLTTDGQEENLEYDETDVENVVFLAEGEDIEGLTPITVANANIRSSNSAAGHADEDTEIVKLEAGIYTVHAVMYDKTKGGGTTFTFKAGEESYELTAGENFSEGEFEVTLNAATSLILAASTHNNMGLDAIYVVKTGDVEQPAEATTVTYALEVGETHTAGETVEVKNGNEVVATLTFGFEGGKEFTAAVADSHIPGFVASTGGNGENGKPDSGTNYIINPKYDGKIEVGVILNADKAFSILEDGAALADYDGIKVAEKYYGTFTFDVKAGKEYKVYVSGSKLGFYGFNYTFAAEGGDEIQYETVDLTADMYHEWDGFGADANVVSETTYMEYKVGEQVDLGATVYGNGSVLGAAYADLTGAVKLVFEGTPGVTARALFNRQSMDGSSSDFVEKLTPIGENGTGEMDLTDLPYVHLNVIKLPWSGNTGTISAIKVVKPAEAGAPGLTLPITEDFEGETSIFEGGELFDAADLGHVLLVKNTTATANLAGYTPAEDEKVTVKFMAYQGWVSGGTFVVALKNSEEKDLVSYTYDCGPCNVTNVAIGGTTVEGFEAFFGQSNSTNAASKGSANIFGHASQPFVATEGYNPQVTMSVTGAGLVEFNFQYIAYNSTEINVTYSEQLPEGTKIDLGSLVLTATGNANAFGIDNLSITSAEAGEQPGEKPTIAWVYTAGYGAYEYAFESDPLVQALQEDYNVVEMSIAADVNPTENEEVNSTLLNADVVVVCEAMAGNNTMSNNMVKYVGQVPVIALKAYNYNSGRWSWGSPANPSPAALSFTANAAYKVLDGVTYEEDGSIKVATETPSNAIQTVTFGAGAPADMVIMGTVGDGSAMYASNDQKFFGIGLSSDCWNYYTENAGIIVKNAAAMLIAGEDLTATNAATGIITTVKPQFEDGAIYNLQGQKVQKAQKGLYIINGKKVLVK